MSQILTADDHKRRGEACFAMLVDAATRGVRCPENGTFGISSALVAQLARAGRIKVLISGKNYRAVEICEGEATGKRTAPDPCGRKPWKIIDKNGARSDGRVVNTRRTAPVPSLAKITAFAG